MGNSKSALLSRMYRDQRVFLWLLRTCLQRSGNFERPCSRLCFTACGSGIEVAVTAMVVRMIACVLTASFEMQRSCFGLFFTSIIHYVRDKWEVLFAVGVEMISNFRPLSPSSKETNVWGVLEPVPQDRCDIDPQGYITAASLVPGRLAGTRNRMHVSLQRGKMACHSLSSRAHHKRLPQIVLVTTRQNIRSCLFFSC